MRPAVRTREQAIQAMETAFGVTIKRPSGEPRVKWIVWSSLHRAAAIAKHVARASELGAEGVFVETESRGSRVGCLNPERTDR